MFLVLVARMSECIAASASIVLKSQQSRVIFWEQLKRNSNLLISLSSSVTAYLVEGHSKHGACPKSTGH